MGLLVNNDDPNRLARTLLLVVLVSGVFNLIFSAKARQIEAERSAAEAQLRLLQGQIEPHFLFNTLANVHSLVDHDPPKAKQMLGAFTDYLRASLGDLRRDSVPLQAELDLARAYLRVQQTRMEERLRFDIQTSPEAASSLLPPLLLQPLVENAVQHGLEPQVSGGYVQIRAYLEDKQLVLDVLDSGTGLSKSLSSSTRAGHGLALANLRERLQTRYGAAASLVVQPASGSRGTHAALRLPFEQSLDRAAA
jgi:sensor histidine kinase YesM